MSIRALFNSPERRFLLTGIGLAFFVMGVSQSLYGPFYNHFRNIFALSGGQVGLLASLHFGGATSTFFLSGFLVRRVGFKPVLMGSTIIFASGFIAVGLGASWLAIRSGALLLGVGFGGMINNNLIIDEAFGDLGAAALNLVNALFSIGAMVAPLLAALSLTFSGGHRLGFLTGAALALIPITFAMRMQPQSTIPEQPGVSLRTVVVGVLVFLLLQAFYVGSESVSGNWIPTSVADSFSDQIAAVVTAGFWMCFTLGRLIAVPLSLRIKPGHFLTAITALGALASLLAVHPTVALVSFPIAGLFIGPIFPVMVSWIRKTFPTRGTRIASIVIATGGLGGIAFPPAIGIAVDTWGVEAIPVGLGTITAGATLACLLIMALFSAGTVPARPHTR